MKFPSNDLKPAADISSGGNLSAQPMPATEVASSAEGVDRAAVGPDVSRVGETSPDGASKAQLPGHEHFYEPYVGNDELNVTDERLAEFRLRYLIRQSMSMAEQTALMDAKASAVMVVVLFFLSNVATSNTETVGNQVLFVVSNLIIAFSLVCTLFVVIPRRLLRNGDGGSARERFSWVGLSDPLLNTEDLVAGLPGLSFVEMARQLAVSNQAMAHTIRRKYFWSRLAFISAGVGFGCAVFAHDLVSGLMAVLR